MSEPALIERLRSPGKSAYGALLIVLAGMLVVYPFLGAHVALSWIFDLMSLAVVVAAVGAAHGSRSQRRISWLLGLIAFTAGLLGRSVGLDSAYPVGAGLRALFFGYLIVLIFTDIMRRKAVTIDAVMGASCAYVLLGFGFGSAYAMLEWLLPGSFHIAAVPHAIDNVFGPMPAEFKLVYFSLVTLTTIGYGDVVPLAAPVRGLAALEGLLSQLYLAIIVARLVGLEIATRLEGSGPGAQS